MHLERIEAFGRERSAGHDPAHDALHLERVVANARRLVESERMAGRAVNGFVVEAACWLHDVVQLPKGEGPPGESARRSAKVSSEFLRDLGVDEAAIGGIAHAVEAHSFSGGMRPETIEGKIVQDADRLDALGAIGIARLWVGAARLGGTLYHPDDPLGTGRDLDDRVYGLDHIERKLLQLPALMNTEAGRVEAERRSRFLVEYRAALLGELGGS